MKKIAFVGGTLFGFLATIVGCCAYGIVKHRKPGEGCIDTLDRLGDCVEKAFEEC